jgi:hypothetical protein
MVNCSHQRRELGDRMHRRLPVAVLAAALLTGGVVAAVPAAAAGPVSLRSGTTPDTRPFPDNAFTVADSTQVTGRRVALPTAGCATTGQSLCDDLALVNQLDGFDIRPRVTLPFTGVVDLTTITPTSVRIDGPGGFSTGLVQISQDRTSGTVSGYPDRTLDQDTTYTLVVGSGIKAADGSAVTGTGRSSSFTTMTTTGVLDKVRAALDAGTAYTDAGIPATDRGLRLTEANGGGRSVFAASAVQNIAKTDQVAVDPKAAGAFVTTNVVNSAKTFSYYGFGSIVSPQYVDQDAYIPNVATTKTPAPISSARLGVTMVSPAPSASCIQPVIFGHGYGDNKFNLFRAADTLGTSNLAVFSTDVLGHGFGPQSTWTVTTSATSTTGIAYGRGKDFDGDGKIGASEGSTPSPRIRFNADGSFAGVDPSPKTAASLRDSLTQTAIDEMALVRVLEKGVDVDGDGTIDTCTAAQSKVAYYGQSWGGMYGALLLGSDPHVQYGVLNVPGSPVADIARLGSFRSLLAQVLQFDKPNLLNGGTGLNGFTEDIPLRLDPKKDGVVQGAVPLQEELARVEWVGRGGSPDAYAARLKPSTSKNVIVQVAYGDGTVPNPTNNELLRAGDLYGKTWVYRADRSATPTANPHAFLTDVASPAHFEGQEQIRRFIASKGADERDPDGSKPNWEPATSTPVVSSDPTATTSAPTADYKTTLDCLHFPDPQTGQDQTRTTPATECTDRSAQVVKAAAAPATRYVALPAAQRVLDSRSGLGTSKGKKTGRFTADLGAVITDAAASAAVLNVTVLNAAKGGYVSVFPEGSPTPSTSNINVLAAVPGSLANTQANEVVTRLSQHRRADVFVATTADVVIDVVGYFTPTAGNGAGRVATVQPQRVLDTRETSTPVRSGEVVVDLSGTTAATATVAILNVTVTRPDHRGYVVAFPTGSARPLTSNVNFEKGQTQANQVTVRVGTGGKVSLGIVDGVNTALVVDLVGRVVPTTDSTGRDFTALEQPRRLIDTRNGTGLPAGVKRGATTFTLPADLPAGVVGVLLNVTSTGGTAAGVVTVYPAGTARPVTSNVNFIRGVDQANEVLTGVSSDHKVVFEVSGGGSPGTQLVVDMVGYLTAP